MQSRVKPKYHVFGHIHEGETKGHWAGGTGEEGMKKNCVWHYLRYGGCGVRCDMMGVVLGIVWWEVWHDGLPLRLRDHYGWLHHLHQLLRLHIQLQATQ